MVWLIFYIIIMCFSFGKGNYAKKIDETLQAKFQWLQKEVSDVVALEIKLKRKLKELLKVCSVSSRVQHNCTSL